MFSLSDVLDASSTQKCFISIFFSQTIADKIHLSVQQNFELEKMKIVAESEKHQVNG